VKEVIGIVALYGAFGNWRLTGTAQNIKEEGGYFISEIRGPNKHVFLWSTK
jgi:hypothetical protein